MTVREMVGGPPMSTGGPAGMGITTLVGSFMMGLGFSARGGAGIPMLWQERAGRAV